MPHVPTRLVCESSCVYNYSKAHTYLTSLLSSTESSGYSLHNKIALYYTCIVLTGEATPEHKSVYRAIEFNFILQM